MRRGHLEQDLRVLAGILAGENLFIDLDENVSKTFPVVQMPLTLNEYVEQILEERNYTFLLYDGSAIQIGYQFDGQQHQQQVISHKLAFFFSPLSLPTLRPTLARLKSFLEDRGSLIEIFKSLPDYLEGEDHGTLFSKHSEKAWQELTWVYGIRLDYNANSQNSASHPQSHATIFDKDCRIAVSDYLDLRRFSLLVFAHLWPLHSKELIPEIQQKLPPRSGGQSLIPNDYPNDYGIFLSLSL
ncbi:hypothetical protein [Thermus sp.]|uniref:hypothetical protein n=1 Tax=Thermus sp. TaxID=275 RepID=UPI003D0C2728